MKKWLRKVIEKIAKEVIKRDSQILTAVNEVIQEIYDNLEELGGEGTLSYRNTTKNADGSITEEDDNKIVTTSFSKDSKGNRVVTEVTKSKDGTVKKTKTTTIGINYDTGRKEIKEVYT